MADRYLVPGGNGNWASNTNWAATSGGGSGASFPVAADNVFMDANSLNTNIAITVAAACTNLTQTSYTGSIAVGATLVMASGTTLTFSSGSTLSGTGVISLNGDYTLTSVNHVHQGGFTMTASIARTLTLVGTFRANGTVTVANSGASVGWTLNTGTLQCGAGISVLGNGNRTLSGTGTLEFVGSTSGSFAAGVNSYVIPAIIFNKTGGTLSMNSVNGIFVRSSSMTYIQGNIVWTASLTTRFGYTFDTGAMQLGTVSQVTDVTSWTMNSQMLADIVRFTTNFTLAGSFGFTTNTLQLSATTTSLTLAAGTTYNVNSAISIITGSNSARNSILSDTPSSYANLILSNSATQELGYVNLTDIDATRGQTIRTFGGTTTRVINCQSITSDVPNVRSVSVR